MADHIRRPNPDTEDILIMCAQRITPESPKVKLHPKT